MWRVLEWRGGYLRRRGLAGHDRSRCCGDLPSGVEYPQPNEYAVEATNDSSSSAGPQNRRCCVANLNPGESIGEVLIA